VTICVEGRVGRLGKVSDGTMIANQLGETANEGWHWLGTKFPMIRIPVFCVMPNHVHAIIYIEDIGRGGLQTAQGFVWKKPLGRIVGAYKTHSTVLINNICGTPGERFWQRNYYERVIRNDRAYEATHNYIEANSANWEKDEYHGPL